MHQTTPMASAPTAAAMAQNATSGHAHGSSSKSHSSELAVNWYLIRSMLWSWLAICGALAAYVGILWLVRYMRLIGSLNNEHQRYFNMPNKYYGRLQKYFISAPLFRTRHHREFRLSRALNVGTLPSRVQTLFFVAYTAMSITLLCYGLPWGSSSSAILSGLTGRSGALAVANMLPLFLLACRNNPLIPLTGIPFDTYNLIHRWLGRVVILTIVVHVTTYLTRKIANVGWEGYLHSLQSSRFILSGTVAAIAGFVIFIQAASIFRHAFYETFLLFHQLLAILFLAGATVHVNGYWGYMGWVKGVMAIWIIERSLRLVWVIYRNLGKGGTRCEVQALPGDAVRVKVKLARPWTVVPGQHAYIYIPSVGWWTNHPFTVAWSDEDEEESLSLSDRESLPKSQTDVLSTSHQNIYFIIRRYTGFTEKLWKKAANSPGGRFTTRALVEGPYASQKLHSYGTVLLFAAGVGITHQVPQVRDLVRGYSNGTVAARRVVLIWTLQSPEHLEWIREWMTTILALPRRREVLKILLYVTRPKNSKEIYSPSSSVQMFPGRPNIQAIVDQEVEQSIGAICCTVCGVGAVADDVRKACRMWMGKVNIDFEEESFSW